MNKIVAVDVDLTVVDTAVEWWKWLEDVTGAGLPYEEVSKHYDFTIPYSQIWKDKEISGCALDFWRQRHLYGNLKPVEGSVDALRTLKQMGYDIVFVSTIKGDHSKSKYYFLEEHFPFLDGVILTKEKGYVKADIVIDDRNKCLNMFPDSNVIKVKVDTPFSQDEQLIVPVAHTLKNWHSFIDWVKEGM